MLIVAWDLDGTLVHTREANLAAYRSFCVRPPHDFHTRPWREWCLAEHHDQKSQLLPSYLRRYASPTPLMRLFRGMGGDIITNASSPAIATLREIFPELRTARIHGGLSPEEKVDWLNRAALPGLYIDDSIRTVEMVRRRTRWQAQLVTF